ncbi:MAG: NAD(P)H-hydrate dehydratase [Desulfovibrionaceae bacterium]|nr:NAD(P)H-hydrate dehydratase [Desulfovibrionaceae bacterium]
MHLPEFEPLPTPAEMAAWDCAAIDDYGLRAEMLMENAAREAFDVLLDEYGPVAGTTALLFAGPGNNGGDAFALARHLLDAGCMPLVLHARPLRAYAGAAGYHARLARRVGVPMRALNRVDPYGLPEPDLVVDGLLGTGFSGALRPEFLDWVECVNLLAERAFVLALDIPSGLDGLTGRPCPVAVRADATATFGAAKAGLLAPEAEPYVGELNVCPIGIPAAVLEAAPASRQIITEDVAAYLPEVEPDMNKGAAGRVLVLGGSAGLCGAPCLAGLAALRAGAGLVHVAGPACVRAAANAFLPDLMTVDAGAEGWRWNPATLGDLAGRFDALAVGPGMGRAADAGDFLRTLLAAERPPTVLDADGLWWLAEADLWSLLKPTDVLTPHPGEAARLLGATTAEVQADRAGAVRALADRIGAGQTGAGHTGATVVLKGAGSLVCAPGAPVYLAPFAAPCLAVGGSGDVLAGLLAALLGRGTDPLPAACLAVYWHGLAGLMLEEEFPLRGNLAQEIAHALPAALADLLSDETEETDAHC